MIGDGGDLARVGLAVGEQDGDGFAIEGLGCDPVRFADASRNRCPAGHGLGLSEDCVAEEVCIGGSAEALSAK